VYKKSAVEHTSPLWKNCRGTLFCVKNSPSINARAFVQMLTKAQLEVHIDCAIPLIATKTTALIVTANILRQPAKSYVSRCVGQFIYYFIIPPKSESFSREIESTHAIIKLLLILKQSCVADIKI